MEIKKREIKVEENYIILDICINEEVKILKLKESDRCQFHNSQTIENCRNSGDYELDYDAIPRIIDEDQIYTIVCEEHKNKIGERKF